MKVSLLRPGDEALLREAEGIFYPESAPSLERAFALLREPTYVMVVAQDDNGEVMGRIYGHVLHRFEATDLLLYEVDVIAAQQRKGAARAMIEYLKNLSRARGWREMWVLTELGNDAGNGLYRASGGNLENSPANMYVFLDRRQMIAALFATVLGIGRAPFAPGTVASAAALPFGWLILWALGPPALLAASAAAYLVGVWATGVYAAGRDDPSECVIDEVAGQWLACAFAPLSIAGFAIAFLLFRFFDITKLWPVSVGETLPEGWGIMTDDMIAGALAAVLIAALRWQGLI